MGFGGWGVGRGKEGRVAYRALVFELIAPFASVLVLWVFPFGTAGKC